MTVATPYYHPIGKEIEVFEQCFKHKIPILLKARQALESPDLLSIWRINWQKI